MSRSPQSAVWPGRLAPPPGWWPACAVVVAAALVAAVGLGGVIGFWALFVAVTFGGCVAIAPQLRFWPPPRAHRRSALTLACAAGVIAAAAGLAALLIMYSFLAGRREYIPSGGNWYGITDAGRLFAGDTRALVNAAGLAAAGIAGNLAVIAGRHCNNISTLGCAAGRSIILIFLTVAAAAVAAATVVGFSAIVFGQQKVEDAAAAAFYNSPYYIPPEPASGIYIDYGGIALLTLSVLSVCAVFWAVLAASAIVGRTRLASSRIISRLPPP